MRHMESGYGGSCMMRKWKLFVVISLLCDLEGFFVGQVSWQSNLPGIYYENGALS